MVANTPVRIPCSACDGDGTTLVGPHSEESRKCSRCRGAGSFAYDAPADELHVVTCMSCGVTGLAVTRHDLSDEITPGPTLCLECGSRSTESACDCNHLGTGNVDPVCVAARNPETDPADLCVCRCNACGVTGLALINADDAPDGTPFRECLSCQSHNVAPRCKCGFLHDVDPMCTAARSAFNTQQEQK